MTYSIVAADPAKGLMGIAAQSHHFGVGAAIVAVRAGIGAVAVQSFGDRNHYGPLILDSLAAGVTAGDALDEAVRSDRRHRRAQVGVVTTSGQAAAATGSLCVAAAGHVTGSTSSVQANMCAGPAVWEEAAQAFESSSGDLANRLLEALDASQRAGGDIRGVQSAVLRVVSNGGSELAAQEADLRVDDHPDPLSELRRLDGMRRAGQLMSMAFADAAAGDVDSAISRLAMAQETYGVNPEPTAWAAVLLARAGRLAEASVFAVRARAVRPDWAQFWTHLPDADLLPKDPDVLRALVEVWRDPIA